MYCIHCEPQKWRHFYSIQCEPILVTFNSASTASSASPVIFDIVGISVLLSVRPSVTRWYCVKMTQATITKSYAVTYVLNYKRKTWITVLIRR